MSENGIINIHGKENYFIDREGNVYSNLISGTRGKRTGNLKKLRPVTAKNGYLMVSLGRGDARYIHSLLLETFVSPRPEGADACHRNDIKTDNRLENLYWGTRAQNVQDALRNNGFVSGEKNGHAKLTDEKVRWILKTKKRNRSRILFLAHWLGVHENTIYDIYMGRTWKHIARGGE